MEAKTSFRTSILPRVPTALSRNLGCVLALGALPAGGGFPMMVSLSHEVSISDKASRSQEDCIRDYECV